jgi:lactose/L-arabinose transport system substrate-binding protein
MFHHFHGREAPTLLHVAMPRPSTFILPVIILIVLGLLIASIHPGGRSAASSHPLDPSKLRHPDRLSAHITAWSWNIAAKSLKSLVPDFQKRWPKIDVNVDMNGTNMETRFLLSLAAGSGAPDIMQLQCFETPRYTATGRLTDLTPVASKYRKDFPASSWSDCIYNGRIYAIPWDKGPCGVFYKPAIFEKYGIDADAIDTWDDFIAAGKTILKKSGGRTKMLPLSPNQIQPMHELLLQQLGGQIFDDQGRIAINSSKSRRAMDLLRKMLDSGICANVDNYSQEWLAGFNSDLIATYPGAVWLSGTIKDTVGVYGSKRAAWRVFPLPAMEPGGLHTSDLGGSTLAIPDQCPNKEAAWAFIEYALCTREGQVAQYKRYDLFPAFLPALSDPYFEQPDPFYGGQKMTALFVKAINGLPVLNRTSDWIEATTYMNQSFTRWAVDHEPTGPMLDTLAKNLSQRLGRPIAPPQ